MSSGCGSSEKKSQFDSSNTFKVIKNVLENRL